MAEEFFCPEHESCGSHTDDGPKDDCGFRADNAAIVLLGLAALSFAYHKRDKILPVIEAGFDSIFDRFLPPREN